MPVYVDNAEIPFGRMLMCHLLADTTAELLAMVDRIGVQRKWIQYPGTVKEHFDVCKTKRDRAIAAGAVPIDWREYPAHVDRKKNSVDNSAHLIQTPAMPRKKAVPADLPAASPAEQLAAALEPISGETLAERYTRISKLMETMEAAGQEIPDSVRDRLPSLPELMDAYPTVQRLKTTSEAEQKALTAAIIREYRAIGVDTFWNSAGIELRSTPGKSPDRIDASRLAEVLVAKGIDPVEIPTIISAATIPGTPWDSIRLYGGQ